MASIWKIGSVDVYVIDRENAPEPKIAEIVPLDADDSSHLHYFGSAATKITVRGKVFSETNRAALETYAKDFTTVALTTDSGGAGNFKIMDFKANQYGPFVELSLPGYAKDDTIYDFTCKLVKA